MESLGKIHPETDDRQQLVTQYINPDHNQFRYILYVPEEKIIICCAVTQSP